MPTKLLLSCCILFFAGALKAGSMGNEEPGRYPAHHARNINVDTRLMLSFTSAPMPGNAGKIKVYDAATQQLVDEIDMSIPPGPKNTRTLFPYDQIKYPGIPDTMYTVKYPDTSGKHRYQLNYIGGNTAADAFHFYPIIIKGNTAIICLHNNKLAYNKTYYVEIDAGVLWVAGKPFAGIKGKKEWLFSTKKKGPAASANRLTVNADGSADFSTVQGAIDHIPEHNKARKNIFIKKGLYDEIVYFRNKHNIHFVGESREETMIGYANNGVFNTRLMSVDPALSGGSHSLRAVFTVHNANGIHISNLTLRSLGEKPAQAEALLLLGKEILVSKVNIEGSGDALQATGIIYVTDSKIEGYGDNVLGYGAVFFNRCDFVSYYGPHLWVRNTRANHGNVLYECTLRTIGDVNTTIARAPNSNGKTYPYVEAVLINCRMEGIRPEGWGQVADTTEHIRYWEYNSVSLEDGKPVDVSKRHPASRQLTMEKDAAIIKNYSNPAFILNGWKPGEGR